MRKRRLLLIASLPLAVAVIVGVLAMMPPRPGVTKINFDRIEEGMTLQEVEQIFGKPGRYTWGGYHWQADDGAKVFVVFGNSAGPKTWQDSTESPLDKLRRWLHLD
jgi:hypothetical protein